MNVKRNMLSIIGLTFLILGTIITSVATISYRLEATTKRDGIEKLGLKNEVLNQKNITVSERNEELNNKINEISSENNELITKTQELSFENKELNNQIQSLASRISKQSEVIENQVTGGDSYGEVSVSSLYGDSNNVLHQFSIYNHGDYPLYEVVVAVRNQDQVKQEFKGKDGMLQIEDLNLYKSYRIGSVPPHMSVSFGPHFKIEEDSIMYWGFSITTKNMPFSQLFKFLKKDGKHFTATYLNTINPSGKGKPSKVLLNEATKGFPNEKDGKIIWEDK